MHKIINDKGLLLKKLLLIILDIACINAATFFALFVRYELSYEKIDIQYLMAALEYAWIDTLCTVIIFCFMGLYRGLWKYASIKELFNIILASLMSYGVKLLGTILLNQQQPKSTTIFGCVILIMLVFVTRFGYRFVRYIVREQNKDKDIKKIMVIGAGDAGNMIIREMRTNQKLHADVVCIIDDDKQIKGLSIQGAKIVGGREMIIESVKKYSVDEIIIAIPSATGLERKKIYDICKETKCILKTIPGMYQIINNEVKISDLKEVEIEDILGRDTIDINTQEIMGYVSNKVVMVTGGGGSIGSELCRQIAEHKPSMLIILDIYENSTYDIQLELLKKHRDLDLVVVIASVNDANRINNILDQYKPNIIFHAAAHKHVPLMECNPNEAVKNNVFGTLTMAEAADRAGVDKFIMISTDKAVRPTNIMGATKRMCEMIIQVYDKRSKTDFVAVRFGNVLGSNGSVIPLFRKQIAEGGPVTVTDREITRFFMTIPEAVALVLQAGYYAKGGEIFVLDMGEPVKIYDLATNMIKLSGCTPDVDIKIEITGLRPGEKLYEELMMDEEGMQKTDNELIYIGQPIEFNENEFFRNLEVLKEITEEETPYIKLLISKLVPTYNMNEDEHDKLNVAKAREYICRLHMEDNDKSI